MGAIRPEMWFPRSPRPGRLGDHDSTPTSLFHAKPARASRDVSTSHARIFSLRGSRGCGGGGGRLFGRDGVGFAFNLVGPRILMVDQPDPLRVEDVRAAKLAQGVEGL